MSKDWIRPQDELPPDGVIVDCINSVGHVHRLKRQGRLWFVPDGSMYVYYEPKFWQPATPPAQAEKAK